MIVLFFKKKTLMLFIIWSTSFQKSKCCNVAWFINSWVQFYVLYKHEQDVTIEMDCLPWSGVWLAATTFFLFLIISDFRFFLTTIDLISYQSPFMTYQNKTEKAKIELVKTCMALSSQVHNELLPMKKFWVIFLTIVVGIVSDSLSAAGMDYASLY